MAGPAGRRRPHASDPDWRRRILLDDAPGCFFRSVVCTHRSVTDRHRNRRGGCCRRRGRGGRLRDEPRRHRIGAGRQTTGRSGPRCGERTRRACPRPTTHPAVRSGVPASALPPTVEDEKANKEEEDEEEDEDSTEPPPRPAPTTPTPPPTYDASIGSVDKSSVSPGDTAFQQSLTFVAQMNATRPRTGVVLDLAISFDQQISVEQFSGSGWACRIQPNGENLEDYLGDAYAFDPGTEFSCSYEFPDENAPPPCTGTSSSRRPTESPDRRRCRSSGRTTRRRATTRNRSKVRPPTSGCDLSHRIGMSRA